MVGIFLSHSSINKPFAKRLGNDLRNYGVKVWIDEAEIKIGDSLIQKISDGLSETDFVIVLLSKASCKSEWVKREVNIALTQEINGKKLIVLPCLIEDCNIPTFLIDKKYADFRKQSKYVQSRCELITAIGLDEKSDKTLFLDQHIFYDLIDLNDGFDVNVIRYFSKNDFKKVLDRVEFFNISIFGIESWAEKQFYDVIVCEEFKKPSNSSKWYKKAFKKLINNGIEQYFSASYGVSDTLIEKFK